MVYNTTEMSATDSIFIDTACAYSNRITLPDSDTLIVTDPIIRQIMGIEEERLPAYRVILFNDEHHTFDQVILQIQKACGYSLEKAEALTHEVHYSGQAVVYTGEYEKCDQIARILMQIGLRVAVELD